MGIFTAVKRTFVGEDTEVGGKNATERDRPVSGVEPAGETRPDTPRSSEADLVVATGRTRKETLLELVEAHEGRVVQADLVDLTGWSKATVSRHLGELEDDGAVDRIPLGRCKVVLLPDEPLVGEHTVSYDAHR